MTIGQFIREECPRYLSMGVSYDEYWYGDYTRLPYYRKANQWKQDDTNFACWLQGWYILQAIACVVPKSEATYPTEPIPMTREQVAEQEAKEKQREIDNARAHMEAMMHSINKQRREKGGDGDG